MNNNVIKFDYEDTDKKIEIDLYGLVFEINNIESVEELEKINKEDINVIENQIEKILGNGSVKKINKKRINDGYKKMDLNIELVILGCIFEAYAKSIAGNMLGRVTGAIDTVRNDAYKYSNNNQRKNKYISFYNRNKNYNNRRRY